MVRFEISLRGFRGLPINPFSPESKAKRYCTLVGHESFMRQYRVYDLSGTGAPDFYNGSELILATIKHRSNHANVSIKSGYVRKVTIGKIQIWIEQEILCCKGELSSDNDSPFESFVFDISFSPTPPALQATL